VDSLPVESVRGDQFFFHGGRRKIKLGFLPCRSKEIRGIELESAVEVSDEGMLADQTIVLHRRVSLRIGAILGLVTVVACWLLSDLLGGQIPWIQKLPGQVMLDVVSGGTVGYAAFLILYVVLSPFWTRWEGGLRIVILLGPMFLLGSSIGMQMEKGLWDRRWFLAGTAVLLSIFYLHERGLSFCLNRQWLEFQQRFPFRRSIRIPWNEVQTLQVVSYRELNDISLFVKIRGNHGQLSISSLVYELDESLVIRMIELSSASAVEWTLREIWDHGSVDLGAIHFYPNEVSWDRNRPSSSMAIHFLLSLFTGGVWRILRRIYAISRPTTCCQLDQISLVDGEIEIAGVAKFRLDEVVNGAYVPEIAARLLQDSYQRRV
jgi:hypothetical protein